MLRILALFALLITSSFAFGQTKKKVSPETAAKIKAAKDKNKSAAKGKTGAKLSGSKSGSSTSKSYNKNSSFFSPGSDMSIMSTNVEFGSSPIDADISYQYIYGHLGLNFDFARKFYIGPYFKHKIASTTDNQVLAINGKMLDMASFKEFGAGISIGTYLKASRKILISPEARVGFNQYTIQDVGFQSNNVGDSIHYNNYLSHSYVSLTPRLNIGFKFSEYSILNFSGGYVFPVYLNGGVATGAYNPSTFAYGIGFRFYFPK